MIGDTPNLAARLQAHGRAWAGSRRRRDAAASGRPVPLRAMAPLELHGVREPPAGLRGRSASGWWRAASRRGRGAAIAPMVGRDQELALLLERWHQARSGEGQLVLLTGEAGIGKSRLAEALIEAVTSEPHVTIRFQCTPYHTDSALHPAIQYLANAAGLAEGGTVGGAAGPDRILRGQRWGRRQRDGGTRRSAPRRGWHRTLRGADPDPAAASHANARGVGVAHDQTGGAPAIVVGRRGRPLDRSHDARTDRAGPRPPAGPRGPGGGDRAADLCRRVCEPPGRQPLGAQPPCARRDRSHRSPNCRRQAATPRSPGRGDRTHRRRPAVRRGDDQGRARVRESCATAPTGTGSTAP